MPIIGDVESVEYETLRIQMSSFNSQGSVSKSEYSPPWHKVKSL